jgi:hypothetical protein
VARQDAIYNVEMSLHGFVIGNTLGIVALHDASDFVGSANGFLFNDLEIVDDIHYHIGGNH